MNVFVHICIVLGDFDAKGYAITQYGCSINLKVMRAYLCIEALRKILNDACG